MSFDNTTPEPKNFYLNLLIKLDFEIATSLYRYSNYADAINGMGQILALINADNEPQLKEANSKIENYLNSQSGPVEELRSIFKKIQKHLNDKWFSELHLGVVPTSTLKSEADRPSHDALDAKQTARL